MAKIKLTRKSYKRNIIVFGVMLFMGIALVSTGFATWVLSQGTEIEVGSPNVNVGVVSDKALKISELKFHYNLLKLVGKDENDKPKYELYEQVDKDTLGGNFSFNFEPLGGDVTGKVKWDEAGYNTESINYEVLTLTITGVISPIDNIKTFEITITLPDGIVKLAEARFIELPEFVDYDKAENGKITFNPYVIADSEVKFNDGHAIGDVFAIDKNGNFTLKIAFGWGERFNYKNPSLYFDSSDFTLNDTTEDGEKISEEDKKIKEYQYIKTCLQELRKEVHGCSFMTLNDQEYEVYTDGTNWCVLKEGSYVKARVEEGVLKEVFDAPAEFTPAQPQFDIKINITAN